MGEGIISPSSLVSLDRVSGDWLWPKAFLLGEGLMGPFTTQCTNSAASDFWCFVVRHCSKHRGLERVIALESGMKFWIYGYRVMFEMFVIYAFLFASRMAFPVFG